tara:strand:- start:1069 stop:1389 length:321 start_codon:yes stop_codon:yes gene_type:complete
MPTKLIVQIDFSGNPIVEVEVHPNSSKKGITGYNKWREKLQISTKSPARKGEANKEIIEIIAEYFHLKKNQIKIISGQTSRFKQIKLYDADIDSINEAILEHWEGG